MRVPLEHVAGDAAREAGGELRRLQHRLRPPRVDGAVHGLHAAPERRGVRARRALDACNRVATQIELEQAGVRPCPLRAAQGPHLHIEERGGHVARQRLALGVAARRQHRAQRPLAQRTLVAGGEGQVARRLEHLERRPVDAVPVVRAELGTHDEQLPVDDLHLAHEPRVAAQVDADVDQAVHPPAATRLRKAVLAPLEPRLALVAPVLVVEACDQQAEHCEGVLHRVAHEHAAHRVEHARRVEGLGAARPRQHALALRGVEGQLLHDALRLLERRRLPRHAPWRHLAALAVDAGVARRADRRHELIEERLRLHRECGQLADALRWLRGLWPRVELPKNALDELHEVGVPSLRKVEVTGAGKGWGPPAELCRVPGFQGGGYLGLG